MIAAEAGDRGGIDRAAIFSADFLDGVCIVNSADG